MSGTGGAARSTVTEESTVRAPWLDLRAAWAGLTPRGGSFLSAGAVALVCALFLRQTDLVRIALLLLALPLSVIVYMALVALHVTVRRSAHPRRGTAGAPVRVDVELSNRSRRRTPTLLVEDSVPSALSARTRVVAPPLPAGATARVSYTVIPSRRGRFVLGPARVHAVEPFGLLERTWRAAGNDELIVRPPVVALEPPLRPSRRGGDGDADHAGASASGDVDLTVREYRDGDDLRRVHWPTTARRGQLMVRRDERPQELRAAIVLDRRSVGHAGQAAASSLEWAIAAAAAVAAHVDDRGHGVSLFTDGEHVVPGDLDSVLDHLAIIEAGPESVLANAGQRLEGASATAVVAILGDVGAAEVEPLLGAARDASRRAFCLRVSTFAAGGGARAAHLDERHRVAVAALSAAGWSVVPVSAVDSVQVAWARAHTLVTST